MSYHIYEDSIDWVCQLHKTKEYRISQRMRKRIEELFGEAKAFRGLGRVKFRRVTFSQGTSADDSDRTEHQEDR